MIPQGTLAERIRAGGAGLGGVLTATGLGTLAGDGQQVIQIDGVDYLVAPALKADFALRRRAQRLIMRATFGLFPDGPQLQSR